MDIEQLRDYCLSLPHSSEGMPFGDGCIVYKVVDRVFAIMAPDGGEPRLSLKCDPDRAEDLRAAYPAIIPRLPPQQKVLEYPAPRSAPSHRSSFAPSSATRGMRPQLSSPSGYAPSSASLPYPKKTNPTYSPTLNIT